MTSGTRCASVPHGADRALRAVGAVEGTASTYGRCGSSPDWSVPVSSRELGQRPDAGLVALAAAPDRQGRAPVAAARERPVDVVVQPVAVAAPLDRVGVPRGLLVLAQQRVLDLRGPDVPGRLGVVHERGVAAPAVRVAVLVGDVPEQQPALLEVLDQVGVGVLEELAADQRHLVAEVAVGAHRDHDRQPVGAADRHVVLAEGGGLVHQAGAVLGGDVVGEHHEVRRGAGGLHRRELDQVEGPLVGPALHVLAGDRAGHGPALAQHRLEQRLGDDQGLGAVGGDT